MNCAWLNEKMAYILIVIQAILINWISTIAQNPTFFFSLEKVFLIAVQKHRIKMIASEIRIAWKKVIGLITIPR